MINTDKTAPPLRQIFLSTVTNEFGDHRRLLKNDLSMPRVQVQEQHDFVQSGGKLLQTLDDYIRDDCHAVIHLVGREVGQPLKLDEVRWLLETYPDFKTRFPFLEDELTNDPPTLSYTQMEAWLALYHNKRCHIYRPKELIADPLATDHPQQVHWNRLDSLGEHYTEFDDTHALRIHVLRHLHNMWPGEVPNKPRPVSLPYHSIGTLFKGRDKFLQQLRDSLHRSTDGRATAIVGRAVHGLGGVGKTRLAVEYAWQHVDDYSAVLFVTADSPENLRRELAGLAGPLVLDLPEQAVAEEEARVAAALRWLNEHPGWFLILDNVDTEEAAQYVETLLARLTGGQVLITSRLGNWSDVVESLDLDVLDDKDAATFLLEKTRPRSAGRGRKESPTDAADAMELARELDGLALALEQAGAYITRLRMSLSEYLKRWQSHQPKVQDWFDRTIQYAGPADKPMRSVAVTWQTTLEQLGKREIQLLNILAWFAPEPIPLSVFKDPSALSASLRLEMESSDAEDPDRPTQEDDWSADSIREALSNLADFSMIRWDVAAETVSVHRVVQEILRTQQSKPKQFLKLALQLLNAARPNADPGDVRTWAVWEPLRPHVAFITGEADKQNITDPTSLLLNEYGGLLKAKGLYDKAEPVMRRALEIDEQSYGSVHPCVAVRLNNLAQLLHDMDRLVEAEPLMRRALTIDEQFNGAEHPNVAIRLNNLAALFLVTNRLMEAEPLMRRALAIDEQTFGIQHPSVARDLNNLARLHEVTNRFAEAEILYCKSWAIYEHCYGTDHPEVASCLNNLAQLFKGTNRFTEAEPLMRRALAIDEKAYGSKHPAVGRDINNLAIQLHAMNRLAEAEPLMRRGLSIEEQIYGAEHPRIAIRLNNLAQLLKATNRLAEAEPLMRRAFAIIEQSYGTEHPDVAIHLNNLAQLLQETNRLSEAEPLMRRALAIDEKSYGAEHPRVAIHLNNLASLLQATNRLAEAEPPMRRALAIDEQSYGAEHPRVAVDLNNLAQLLQSTSRLLEAEPLMRRALAIDEQSYGTEHLNVAFRLNNLAAMFQATNRLAEAKPLMRRALDIFERCLGQNHPHTITAQSNLQALSQPTMGEDRA